jgi:hypothetical protein
MNDGLQKGTTTRFVLIAVKHEAGYWTPRTIAEAIHANDLLDPRSEEGLALFRDGVLRGLVGRAAEKFWASDALTPPKAAAIRSACQALHGLTIEVFEEVASESAPGT